MVSIITEEMILNCDGWMGRRPCCFQCKHRVVIPFKNCPTVPRDDGHGTIIEDIVWHKVRVCDRNPHGMHIYGDTGQCCGLFELDRERWHDLKIQAWEWRNMVRRRGGQTSLEDFS